MSRLSTIGTKNKKVTPRTLKLYTLNLIDLIGYRARKQNCCVSMYLRNRNDRERTEWITMVVLRNQKKLGS